MPNSLNDKPWTILGARRGFSAEHLWNVLLRQGIKDLYEINLDPTTAFLFERLGYDTSTSHVFYGNQYAGTAETITTFLYTLKRMKGLA